jgi:hydroxymethylpyrimidine/phosphomethylpyrimidine kinase
MADIVFEETRIPRVLIVAGSDSSGGAGIQADLKTVTALGGFGMTAITAITAQDTTGVHDVWPVPVPAVLAQAGACLGDIGADVIKTGMLGSSVLIEALAELFAERAVGVPRIIDPVMVATSGARLLEASAVDVLRVLLIVDAALVTPNAPEAEILTGKAVEDINGQRRAAEALLELGARAALVKGGHIEGDILTDVLQTHYGEWLIEASRIDTTSTHGTGCTLASAVATRVGHGDGMDTAVQAARAWLSKAISAAPGFGRGAGPVHHGWQLSHLPE